MLPQFYMMRWGRGGGERVGDQIMELNGDVGGGGGGGDGSGVGASIRRRGSDAPGGAAGRVHGDGASSCTGVSSTGGGGQ